MCQAPSLSSHLNASLTLGNICLFPRPPASCRRLPAGYTTHPHHLSEIQQPTSQGRSQTRFCLNMATHPGPSTPHIVDDIGDYVDAEDEQDVECESEPRARYIWDKSISSRWYCPIRIGEVLHQQYRIEHKVGWGGFSTVWLARDLKTNRLVSLKVLCNSPHAQSEHRINLDILARCGPDISEYLVVLQTAFHLRNPDRIPLSPQYRVLVLPVRGPSLKTACFKIRPAVRILAARHLLIAIKRLHDAGIIHAGQSNSLLSSSH